MNEIDNILKGLNHQQHEAVSSTEGYVRVIAGAGSGKTKALTSRYAYIVDALGISPSNILCVTFTNKAAQEMKRRVKQIIGQDADLGFITTYHGFCVKALREDINKIQYPKNFVIMDVEDQKTILRQVFNELGLDSKVFTFKQVLRFIGRQKTNLSYLDMVLGKKYPVPEDDISKVFHRYLEKQQRNFALDFDDLINFTIYIFGRHDDILEKWQDRLHYIQVDETQDSSEKQFNLVEMLSRKHKNLFMVGDPDQTIYEWRGAKPEFLVNFDQFFPDSKTVIMNQNYRSTPNILALGNHIIKNNKVRVEKDMFTNNDAGVDVIHFHAKNDFEEGLFISSEIKRLINEGAKNSDCAVLYRAGHVSRIIEQNLIRAEIPYSIFGGIRFFERKEIKDVLAYLRLIEFGDDLSFLRIINTPSRGLGKKYIQTLAEIAEAHDISLFNALMANIESKELGRKGAVEFLQLIEALISQKEKLSISDLVDQILTKTGLKAFYRTDGDTDRLDNIKELQSSIIQLENEDEEQLVLNEYLQEIALYTDMDVEMDAGDRVKLMTIHTAKGLEFPYVFLAGFSEGIIPSAMSIKEKGPKAIEEERRLAYVAITRAEKGFYMTESEGHNFTTGTSKFPSRFLFEISEEFFVRKGVLSDEVIQEANAALDLDLKSTSVKPKFRLGQNVIHPVWKEGKIIEVHKQKQIYEVLFIESQKVKPIEFSFKGLKIDERKSKIDQSSNFPEEDVSSEPEKTYEEKLQDEISEFRVPKKIMEKIEKLAEEKEPENLEWRKSEILRQLKGYEFMSSVKDKSLKRISEENYPDNYHWQKDEYERQLSGFEYMKSVKDAELKKYANNEYPNNYSWQKDEYEKQLIGREEMSKVKDKSIKKFVEGEYPLNYSLQKYVYDQNVEAKEYMKTVDDLEVKKRAVKEWPKDFTMQQHIYNEQVKAKLEMSKIKQSPEKRQAIKEWPDDYVMQVHIYKELVS